jgi:Tfp pilus assembly protein PilN
VRGVNLIPASILRARRRSVRIKLWCAGLTVYALALVGAGVWVRSDRAAPRDWTADIEQVTRASDAVRAELDKRRADLDHEEAAARAAESVAGQPDWSMLLALIARSAGDSVWVETTALKPILTGTPEARPRSHALVLALSGLGESQDAVSSFAIAMENLGLFKVVRIIESRRQANNGREAFAFRLECTLEVEP